MNKNSNLFEIILLIMLVSLSTFSTNLYIPALPSMVLLFHTNSVAIQQSLVSFTYGFAFCMILSGVLADGIGRKKTLIIGISIYCITSLIALFSQNLFSLIGLRFLQGLGGCCGTVVARVIVRDQFDDKTAIGILALLSSGMAVAFIIAPIVGSFLVHFFSWKACFIMMFLTGIFIVISIFFTLPESKNEKRKINIAHAFLQYSRALRSNQFLIHTFVIAIAWSGFFLMVMEYPFIMMTQLKLSVVKFGVIFSIILLGYLAGSRIARQFSRFGLSSDNAVMYGIMIMCFAALGTVIALSEMTHPNDIILTIGGFLYLVGMGIQIPNSQFAAIPAEEKGSATMTSLLYFFEMIIVALLNNFFKAHFSTNPLTLWCALLFSMLVTLFIFMAVMKYASAKVASAN